jgi:hypothetical protein
VTYRSDPSGPHSRDPSGPERVVGRYARFVCEVVAGKAWILAELLKKMRPKVSFSEKLLRALNWNGRFVEEFFEKLLYFEEILRISSKRMIFEEILRISSKRMIFEECWPKGQHSSRNIFILEEFFEFFEKE